MIDLAAAVLSHFPARTCFFFCFFFGLFVFSYFVISYDCRFTCHDALRLFGANAVPTGGGDRISEKFHLICVTWKHRHVRPLELAV